MTRLSWDEYFLGIAEAVSRRADCTRRQIGAVIVRDHRIVATGYNGAPAGKPGCLSEGACPRGHLSHAEQPPGGSYEDCHALHAELNACIYAGREGCLGSTLYITDDPCDGCKKVIRAAGILHVRTPMLTWDLCP